MSHLYLVCAGVCISVSAVFIPTLQCEWKLSDTEVALVPFVSPTSVDTLTKGMGLSPGLLCWCSVE